MDINSRPVVVKRMPERLNSRTAREFLRDVRPFDLSLVAQIDAAGVEMLLRCMSEAHKRDGDVKLASLSDQAAVVLELTRTERLFEIYETSTEAARSFSGFLPNAMRQQLLHNKRSTTPTLAA
jgi:anti-anti-sigma regulatory factor